MAEILFQMDKEREAETIGKALARRRDQQGLSLRDVARITRVGVADLERIERGAYDELPARLYCIGFVRAYAVCVDFDPEEAVARVKAEMGQMSS